MSASRFGANRRFLAPRDSRDSRFEQPCTAAGSVWCSIAGAGRCAESRSRASRCDSAAAPQGGPWLSHAGCERASSEAPAGFRGNNVRPLPRAPARLHSSAFGSAPPRCAAEKEGGEGGGRLTAHDCMVAPAVTVPSTLSQRAWRRLESCRGTPPVRCSGPPGPSHRLTAGGREREREGEEEGRSERKRGS